MIKFFRKEGSVARACLVATAYSTIYSFHKKRSIAITCLFSAAYSTTYFFHTESFCRSLLQKSPIKKTIFCNNASPSRSTFNDKLLSYGELICNAKLQVSFAKEPYKRDDILQKSHIPCFLQRIQQYVSFATRAHLQWICHRKRQFCSSLYLICLKSRFSPLSPDRHVRAHVL